MKRLAHASKGQKQGGENQAKSKCHVHMVYVSYTCMQTR